MGRVIEYLGPLGDSATHCMTVGIEAYKIDADELAKRLKVASKSVARYEYYLIKASPGFKTEDLSRDHRIDLGAKRAELDFFLKFGIAKDRFPEKEEEREEKEVECEYGVTVSAKGEVEFKPFKGSIGPEARWRKVTKFKISTINTYCYGVGRLTATPGWIFEPRAGENHLEADKEVGLTVEVPKGRRLSGRLKMFCRDIVLLDGNHKGLSWRKKFVARIKGLVMQDKYYKPIKFEFPMHYKYHKPIEFVLPTQYAAARPRGYFPSSGEPAARYGKLYQRKVVPRLSNRTLEIVEKELSHARAKGLL